MLDGRICVSVNYATHAQSEWILISRTLSRVLLFVVLIRNILLKTLCTYVPRDVRIIMLPVEWTDEFRSVQET